MAFPQTRHTLIQRLALGGEPHDWSDFLADYWGPICRFALRRGDIQLAEAEDIASQTFEVVVRNDLLSRWVASRQAKLRTLLCNVVCKVQANARRAGQNRRDLLKQLEGFQAERDSPGGEVDDVFFASWVEDLLQGCLVSLAEEYHGSGRGDYFRVLYGRLCEQMSIADVAGALKISPSAVDNYYRHVRRRLAESLEAAVRSHVFRYSAPDEAEGEFAAEWGRLGLYLKDRGGLEEAVRRVHEQPIFRDIENRKTEQIHATLTRISAGDHLAQP